MNPICVFLCEDQLQYDQYLSFSEQADYHRFFMLSTQKILRNNLTKKHTDNYMTYRYDLSKVDEIIRLITCYTNPIYSHLFLVLKNNFIFDEEKNNFINNEVFQNDNCIGFTRQYVALNGFNFKPVEIEKPLDPLLYAIELNKAMNEEPVTNLFFIEALKELLPTCQYQNYENLENIDNEIKKVFKEKTIKSESFYEVLYEPEISSFKNAIVFTYSSLSSYKFSIKRDDGLNCFIF